MHSLTARRIAVAIFALAWVVRVAIVLVGEAYREPINAVESVQVARSVAAGQGFSNPYNCVTGATAHLAPVYPYLVSLIYRAIPSATRRQLARYVLSATITSLIYAMLPWLAVKLRCKPEVGMFAGFAGAAVPLFFWVEVASEWEAPLLTLLLIIALGLFADLFGSFSLRPAVAAGTAWGVALLTAPTLIPVFLALMAALIWRHRRCLPSLRITMAALIVPVLLLILPWSIRNYGIFHKFILIRGNAGMQLSMSFNERSRATFEESTASGAFADYPYTTLQVCREFARWGEVAMNRRYEQQAIEWIRENPGRSARLIIERFVAFWRMAVPSRAKSVASGILTVSGLMGLVLCLRRRAFAGQLTGLVLLTYPLPYYLNIYETRYRYPLHPLLLLLASIFVSEAVRRFRKNPDRGSVF